MSGVLSKAAGIAATFVVLQAAAQGFPSKPIHIVVPYPAGGTTDIMARALQEPMQKALGQPVIVDNKAGAGGAIAAREVARSPADGYTLLFSNNGPSSTVPLLQKDAGYDSLKDFAAVSLVSTAPMFVVVNGAVPVANLAQFISWAKAQPDPVQYATAGVGSMGHLSSALFGRAAGIRMAHIPYKGQAPTTNAVLSGEVKVLITTASAAMNGYLSAGRLKLLGVSSAEPSPLAPPGTPLVKDALPGYVVDIWFGILGPAGMPADVIAKLNDAIGRALALPELQTRFRGFGVIATASTPARLHEMIATEVPRWAQVVRDAGIKAD